MNTNTPLLSNLLPTSLWQQQSDAVATTVALGHVESAPIASANIFSRNAQSSTKTLSLENTMTTYDANGWAEQLLGHLLTEEAETA
jgi:hypothetical protein